MTQEISITIDGQTALFPLGTTLLAAAQSLGISIPTICYHKATTSNALCRICVVEVEGARTLVPACIGQVTAGMVVHTRSPRVERARRSILEMLASSVDLSEAPEIQEFISEYGADPNRYEGAVPRSVPLLDDNPMFVRDYSKCILCWRCIQVCAEDAQYTYAIDFKGRGYNTQVGTFYDKPLPETTCVFCGQCVGVCPTGALKPKREYLLEMGLPMDEVLGQTRTERRRKKREDV